VPQAQILVAEMDGVMEGFVTVDPKTGYLDQIVVAPEFWGSNVAALLLDAGKRVSPARLDLLVNKGQRPRHRVLRKARLRNGRRRRQMQKPIIATGPSFFSSSIAACVSFSIASQLGLATNLRALAISSGV
jgi:hypothetical protein